MESIQNEIKQEEKSVMELCDKMGIRSDSVLGLFSSSDLKIWENERGMDRRQGRSLNEIRDIVAKTRDSLAEVIEESQCNNIEIRSAYHWDTWTFETSVWALWWAWRTSGRVVCKYRQFLIGNQEEVSPWSSSCRGRTKSWISLLLCYLGQSQEVDRRDDGTFASLLR